MTAELPHAAATPRTLGVVRAAVFAIWLLEVVPDPLSFLAALPDAMRRPVGVFGHVPGALITAGALDAFKAILVALIAACLAGLPGYRVLAPLTALALTVDQALLRDYTFVNHEELALLIVTWVLALFPAADGFSWPARPPSARPEVYVAAMRAAAAFLLLPYCLIAAHRLATAAPAVFTGESLPYWFASLSSLDRDGWGVGVWLLGHPWLVTLFKAGFFVTTCFELLAPLCLVLPRFRRAWIAVVVTFHLVNWFTLNLFFWQNALLVPLLVAEWEPLLRRWSGRLQARDQLVEA
jgi:hypothetical protein